ncbi:unnamed protein product [Parnassius apollo]|uniref:(apollo) hypothetical protein n=1 Tax=Parnassius apollo TaxID=110799 RepID=A0A8S3W799_PARAO|nr:unnamed protein product [Parnassius apollo]
MERVLDQQIHESNVAPFLQRIREMVGGRLRTGRLRVRHIHTLRATPQTAASTHSHRKTADTLNGISIHQILIRNKGIAATSPYDHKTDNGRVFGTLGQNDAGLFGKGGYEHNFFDDDRGKLDGQVYGTRVLGPYGDSSHLGGALNWQNPNAAASLEVSKQIHGPDSIMAGAGGRWPVGKNGDFSLEGTYYGKTSGYKPEYGGRGVFNYRW